jgi:hypothetical protein
MIKNILLLFSMAILILFQNLFSGSVNVKTKMPEKIKPGDEFTVELTIEKGNISGFAKLQNELPEGFTASAIESKSASFTFIDQKVKYIWMSLPTESDFKISYKVKVGNNVAPGNKSISGSFSYLENNDKQNFEIASKNITVEGAPLAQQASPQTSDDDEDEAPVAKTTPVNNQPASIQGAVAAFRKIEESGIAKKDFLVEITINKANTEGFAKLQEVLPKGFTATGVETKNAAFSFVDQKAKFVWMSLPAEKEFKVSYRVKIDPNITGNYFINGEFSYIVDGETRKSIIPQQSVKVTDDAPLADVTPQTQNGKIPVKEDTQKLPVQDKPAKLPVKDKPAPAVTKAPPAQHGVNYRVQIAAGHTLVNVSYFDKKYGVREQIYTEMHEGWNKYTIGGYNTYADARNNRESSKSNYGLDTGPFVTAYNNGERITVQEALMITNQRWVQ